MVTPGKEARGTASLSVATLEGLPTDPQVTDSPGRGLLLLDFCLGNCLKMSPGDMPSALGDPQHFHIVRQQIIPAEASCLGPRGAFPARSILGTIRAMSSACGTLKSRTMTV